MLQVDEGKIKKINRLKNNIRTYISLFSTKLIILIIFTKQFK